MKTIKIDNWLDIPGYYTGIAEFTNGDRRWYKNGEYHREDGPAVEWSDGDKSWYKNGELHRLDGPAKERSDGSIYWYKNGKLHRENGPAIAHFNGDKYWYLEGICYIQINLKDYIVLDYYQGKYGLMWYRLLDKDQVFESPDIPGLIINHSSSE